MVAALLVITSGLAAQGPQQPGPSVPPTTGPATTASAPLTPKEIAQEKQHQADVAYDVEQGKRDAAEVEKQIKLSTNKEYQARVQRIGAEIAQIANAGPTWHVLWGDKRWGKFDYTYKVLQGDDVNAFSIRGGHIYVYEGLMKQIESDDELAGVLGHETAHAAFRHVATLAKESEKINIISLPLILASLLLGGGAAAPAVLTGTSLAGQTVASGWSVHAEEAADYGGMQFLLKSHYDPSGMLTFMERLAADEKLGPNIDWGIYRDHPPSKERAETLMGYMAAAGAPIRRSRVTTSFRVTVHPADNGTVELDFGKHPLVALGGSDALTRADAAVTTLNSFFDTTPQLYDVQAGPSGSLIWQGRPLLQLTDADAMAGGTNLQALRDKALENMRVAMFNLGFHVWSSG